MTAAPLNVSGEDRAELERMAVSTVLPYRQVVQASGLLLAADGVANNEIARRCATTADTVRRWRTKFESGGISAVGSIAAGRGRKPALRVSGLDPGQEAASPGSARVRRPQRSPRPRGARR